MKVGFSAPAHAMLVVAKNAATRIADFNLYFLLVGVARD
jgi:hypothetical protein